MGYYDTEKGVREYIKMAEGYDGAFLIDVLKIHLPADSSILELGMGPGKDLDLMKGRYRVTGSDVSQEFLDRYRKANEKADLIRLDAVSIDTDRRFDGIYSNKVLYHLTREELISSLMRQKQVLNRGGVIMHSFWYGEQDDEEAQGLRFVYYTIPQLREIVNDLFEIIETERYREMDDDDSIYILARKAE